MLKYIVIIYIVLSILMFDPKLFTGGDNVVYLCLAKSLASGEGYRDLYKPGQPRHEQFPIGFPLLLSGAFLINPHTSVVVLKFLIMLFGLGCLFFFYKLCENIFGNEKWIPIMLFLTTPVFYFYNHVILSEIPFLFFVLGVLYFASIKDRNDIAVIGMAVIACLIRSMGFGLLIGLSLYFLTKRGYYQVFLIIGIGVVLSFLSGGSPYMLQLMAKDPYNLSLGIVGAPDIFGRIWDNLTLYLSQIMPLTLYPDMPIWLTGIFSFLLVGIVGYGGYQLYKRSKLLICFLIPMILIILIWPPVWSSDRFLIPVLPMIIIAIALVITSPKSSPARGQILRLVWLPVVIGILFNSFFLIRNSLIHMQHNVAYIQGDKYAGYNQEWINYFETIEQLNLVQEKTTVIARKPMYVWWLTGHVSNEYKMTDDVREIQSQLLCYEYVIIDGFTWTNTTPKYLLPSMGVNNFAERFKVMYKTEKPEFFLLRRT